MQTTLDKPARNQPAATPACSSRGPLSESDFAALRAASLSRKTIDKAAKTAFASAIIMLAIGGCSLPTLVCWPGWANTLVIVGVCVCGLIELLGSRRMKLAEVSGPKMLVLNQLALMGVICLYCLLQVFGTSTAELKAAALSPEFRSQLSALPSMASAVDGTIDRWAPVVIYCFYGLVILATAIFQGGMAVYYHSRRKHVEAYNRGTPFWIRRLHREVDI